MEEPTHFSLPGEIGGRVSQSEALALGPTPAVHFLDETSRTLPERYNVDRLQLMVQSPFRVFAYWEVTPERLQKALAPFPKNEQPAFRMILRWIEVGKGMQQAFDSGAASEWWFAARPGSRYQAELCLHSEEFGAISVFTSNEVETPSDSVVQTTSEIEDCAETTKLLSRLVDLTGLKRELKEEDAPMPIIEGATLFEMEMNSKKKLGAAPRELRKDPPRPTSFFW